MRQPEELYELDQAVLSQAGADLSGAAFLVHLEGFMGAGSAGRLVTEHLLDELSDTVIARFDTDRLLDYRSRRPLMTFDKTRWESYDDPRLEVHLLRTGDGKPVTLLTGPEPDHEWDLFVAAARRHNVCSSLSQPSHEREPDAAGSADHHRRFVC